MGMKNNLKRKICSHNDSEITRQTISIDGG